MARRHQRMAIAKGGWKYKGPAESVRLLTRFYGPPSEKTQSHALWKKIAGFDQVVVKDERIPHSFPMKHFDWMYGTVKLKIPAHMLDDLAKVTGSIIYDGLKQEVTARCQKMIKNAVTIGFVQDVVRGKIPLAKAKKEYARRIIADITPSWYVDLIGERR